MVHVAALVPVCTGGLAGPSYADPLPTGTDVDYRRADFRWTCEHVGDRLPVVLRDRDLSPTGVREWC